MRKVHSLSNSIIRLGFVPLVDCAPIVMAHELGLFKKHDLQVELRREIGWATIRDKIIYGELQATQAPAGLMVAVNCGLGCVRTEAVTGMVLNLHGNAITLSQALWREGVRDGDTLRRAIRDSGRRFTFGVVHNYSSHSFLLRDWLKRHGIQPERDTHIVVVPPPQMAANLKAGHLDGYCVGEPWSSAATLARTGWTVATSNDLAPSHPEKVLMVQRSYAENHEKAHLQLIAALLEACDFCDRPENRGRLIETLAQPQYVGAPAQVIGASLGDRYDFGNGRRESIPDFHIFHRFHANTPTLERARWVIRSLHASGLISEPDLVPLTSAAQWFRADIFERARLLLPVTTPG